ncbi:transglutaminase-like domain-containing protein [Propionivibrio sp.]|uniref:transglutaminase-like domain-containing protein n=1 Tax=Propionivibrio sp. TaxID=2212460 RepID=UPI0025F9BF04|nr:transglutaminase-like domain-containing protein [Propionivibrio sp.]MBK7356873.1 transglutaminase domain-containing protein [Propionivibrio sp.]MBK8401696.1 transglutaminase domain-containing protein [Propionivibrio sp.]MBK8745032.1 transglutaminase domain-containing protein [Propionivibrio sp.]MBK8893894.1 transglutaminase domain-containing protein [Propionivibrio sp.]MBL0208199.1 transglutaminase domain-containing protein [Propionivibrio sp.]
MKRRDFLAASAVLALLASPPANAAKKAIRKNHPPKPSARKPTRKKAADASQTTAAEETRNVISLPDEPLAHWRAYDIRSTIALRQINGKARLWIPLAQYKDTAWERSLGHNWQGNFENAGIYRDPVAEMEVFYADWPEGTVNPQLQIVSQIATQDRHFDITRRGAVAERTEVLRRCLQSTSLVPTDGIVRHTAERAIGRVRDPVAQGKAIYDWVVDNVSFDPQMKGVGNVNIGRMLESGNLNGRSADIALLFVGMCRSIGIPARPVFGLRMDSSRLFGSLGTSGNLSTDQHCRAEFYTPGYGWIPVEPSDVSKAIRDEHLIIGDPKLTVLKKLLFGFWEMNWISFNVAQDVSLRGSTGQTLPFLIYPVVETAGGRFNSLDSSHFSYSINASRTDI